MLQQMSNVEPTFATLRRGERSACKIELQKNCFAAVKYSVT
jgi:hypothetical protein